MQLYDLWFICKSDSITKWDYYKTYTDEVWCYDFYKGDFDYGIYGYCGCSGSGLKNYMKKYGYDKSECIGSRNDDSDHDEDFEHHLYELTGERKEGKIFHLDYYLEKKPRKHLRHYIEYYQPKDLSLLNIKTAAKILKEINRIKKWGTLMTAIPCWPRRNGARRLKDQTSTLTLIEQNDSLKDYVDEPCQLAKICYALVEYCSKDHQAEANAKDKIKYYTYKNNTVEYCMHIFKSNKEVAKLKYKRLYFHSTKDGIDHYIAVFDRVTDVYIYLERAE